MRKIFVRAVVTNDELEKSMSVLVDNGIEKDEAETVLQSIGYSLLKTELFPEETQDWDFDYDEEIPDTAGSNFIGLLREKTTGNTLFFHAQPDLELGISVCKIFDSITSLYSDENELCSYDWCADNDSLVLEKLNSLNIDSNAWCGENCVLSSIEFYKSEDRVLQERRLNHHKGTF